MIKRTLYFNNPAYLNIHKNQLIVTAPHTKQELAKVPVEDIGIVCLDNPQITLTHNVLQRLLAHNAVCISCDTRHLPHGLMFPMYQHSLHTKRLAIQITVSLPLKKRLWQQTVSAKIYNQYLLLQELGVEQKRLHYLSQNVQSGDVGNTEAQAARIYWSILFDDFTREREGVPPNNLLNFGYAILRSIVARALVSSGLSPAIGIHHKNQYNPYCLADDIMEPYRPFLDFIVFEIVNDCNDIEMITPTLKSRLLQIATIDVEFDNITSPLMVGISRTTASLFGCFNGDRRKIIYPKFIYS